MFRPVGVIILSVLVHSPAETMPPVQATLDCAGDVVTVRRIAMKPPATIETYLKTMDSHRAWYRSHGFKDNEIFVARILVTDPLTRAAAYSPNEFIAYHIRPPYPPNTTIVRDAAWIEFHKTYNEISAILEQYQICMPRDHGG